MNTTEATAATPLADLKNPLMNLPDQRIDMFSARGFALACKIANAFSSSDAVPAIFRNQIQKGKGKDAPWVDNPSGLGNCIIAIETAMAVGMSIIAVMQNANIIEGKLTWSAQFVIAAVNASHRFTPLRFDMQDLGQINAKYREKLGWNEDKSGYDFADRDVDVQNLQCIAWALPAGMAFPPGVYTMAQARAAGLPVIESAPVSMKLAVEEGWYAKPGSKWQTEMKHLMLMYRAGTFFGRIHAPDVVMGMGRTKEEIEDTIDTAVGPDGVYAPVPVDTLKPKAAAPVDVVEPAAAEQAGGEPPAAPAAEAATKPAAADAKPAARATRKPIAAE